MNFEPGAFADITSPALLVWPASVGRNIASMIAQVGGEVSRLRPHVKTHKMVEVVRLQLAAGIAKFKCSTIAEAEMLANTGAPDVLLAYQPVGPNIARLAELVERFPAVSFAALVDDRAALGAISECFSARVEPLRLFVDVDCGMGRTGISHGVAAFCREVEAAEGVGFAGLHVYDGHLRASPPDERGAGFEGAFGAVRELVDELHPEAVVGGGSPTFGLHAERTVWECSPGTTIFWDAGYGERFPDLGYELAAALLTRVISKPGQDRLCLDLGHKAVAAENPLVARVRFPGLHGGLDLVAQSEEHLVLEYEHADQIDVGQALVGVPVHICPTVALHMEAVLVSESGEPTGERWKVAARDRRLTV